MANALLTAKGVTVTFGGVDVVASVDLDLRPGEIHALVGENGAGKSSLAKAIAGVYRMRLGSVALGGEEVRFRNPREALAAGVALIHQEPLTFLDLDVTENIFAGNFLKRGPFVDRRACENKTRELLASLGVKIDPREKMSGLSVANRQMVELASALAHDAKVWIFDETTAPLTPKEVAELFEVIKKLRDQRCAIVMVTHHLEEVFLIADRITVMRDGQKVAELNAQKSSHAEVVKLMVGRDLEHSRLHGATAGKEVLELKALCGAGFQNVDLKVCKGEVVGLAGLVGAGRTELVRAVFGAATATSGDMHIEGKEAKVKSPREARKRGIALVPEDRIHDGLLMPQSIAFNATLANLPEVSNTGFLDTRQIEAQTKEYADRLSLSHRSVGQPVAELSGGNQQKVVLSKWLMTKPKLLILDEPTRGVDVGAKREVHKIIRNLADEGLAVLIVSSDLPEVLALCDRTYVMREGRIVAEIKAEDATEEAVMTHATGAAK